MIGLVHPGSMGAAVGRVLLDRGHDVGWASAGRSDATRAAPPPSPDGFGTAAEVFRRLSADG